jgi:hypothetical protein
MSAVVSAVKNDAGKFDCPVPECEHKGAKGAESPAGLAMHVRANHRPLWDRLYKKQHGELPGDSQAKRGRKPMNGKAAKHGGAKHAAELVGARYSARPRIDRRIENAAHENGIATMEAACEIMALPSVRDLRPHEATGLFMALVKVHERQAAKTHA